MGADNQADETCGTCGAVVDRAARFCSACGALVGAAPVYAEIATPSGPSDVLQVQAEPEQRRPMRLGPLLLVVGLGLAGLAAAVAAVVLTEDEPEPDALPPTTTLAPTTVPPTTVPPTTVPPTSVPADDDPADQDAAQLAGTHGWSELADLGDVTPLAFGEHEGTSYVFATGGRTLLAGYPSAGLWGWRSADGTTWEPMGRMLGDDAWITAVDIGPRGFVAAGTGPDQQPIAWRSADGDDWEREELPVDRPGFVPQFVVAGDDVDVIAGRDNLTPGLTVATALEERFADRDLDGYGLGTFQGGSSAQGDAATHAFVTGPFGIVMASVEFGEIGLDPSGGADDGITTAIWSSDGDAWSGETLDDVWPAGLTSASDGSVLLSTTAPEGSAVRRSPDGEAWSDPVEIDVMAPTGWRDRYIARSRGSGARLAVADDLTSWHHVPLEGLLEPMRDPLVIDVSAGREAMAVVAMSWGAEDPDIDRSITSTFVRGEYTLTASSLERDLVLYRDGDEVSRFRPGSLSQPHADDVRRDPVAADLERETVAFLDPASGDVLIEFTVEELRDLEAGITPPGEAAVTVLTSRDTTNWFRGVVPNRFGPMIVTEKATVAHGQVLAAATVGPRAGAPDDPARRTILLGAAFGATE